MTCWKGWFVGVFGDAERGVRHAAGCAPCAAVREADQRLAEGLRHGAGSVRLPPPDLHDGIMRAVVRAGEQTGRHPDPHPVRWVALAAAVPVLAVAILLALRSPPAAAPKAAAADWAGLAGPVSSFQAAAPNLAMAPVAQMNAAMTGEWNNMVADLAEAGDFLLRSIAQN